MAQRRFRVGIVGGTGFVGQRFLSILDGHPWFETVAIAASERSAGKAYAEAVEGRWKIDRPMPESAKGLVVRSIADIDAFCDDVDFVFCAVDMKKDEIKALEERMARRETPVVSNNSAHRWTSDVPVIVPELNPEHTEAIPVQRKRLGTRQGFITAKPNCSIQSYVPALHPLRSYGLRTLAVCTYQAISGAGKTFSDWPEMVGNLIPYIGGEEEKSEQEPLRIWGTFVDGSFVKADAPRITAQCYRVSVAEGHTAAVSVQFDRKPSREEILAAWASYEGIPQKANLPSAPKRFLAYLDEDARPQPALDRDRENGMAVTIGRLREDPVFDWKFACLSHNTLRGAAGGAVLTAELLAHQGYIVRK